MLQEEMIQLLRARPFRPFRLHLANGETHDVRQPELVWVTPTKLMIALPSAKVPVPAIDYYVTIALNQVSKVEPLS
jgi:hypothetical protein